MEEFELDGQSRAEPIRGFRGRALAPKPVLRRPGSRSMVVVPRRPKGTIAGAATLVAAASRRAYHSLARRSVLVVDDDEDVREIVGAVLTQHGHEVSFATNGSEALEYLSHAPAPFVIVLDLVMPQKDGWAFLLERSRDVALSSIPVIVVSAGAGLPKGATLANAVYLAKPFHTDALLGAIRALLH